MAGSSSPSPVPDKSEVEREEMLDRMLTRLALCEDSNLQNLLSKLLPLSISSLSSNSTAVRNKVIEILSHVNKRVKHQLDIGLPLLELWNMYIEPNATPMVKNFCIVYVEMAFERVQMEVKEDMVPLLVANISKLPTQHQEIILRISAKVEVNGQNAVPLYKFLKAEKGGLLVDAIKWNFTKFLVNKEGKVMQRYAPSTSPLKIEEDIQNLLGSS